MAERPSVKEILAMARKGGAAQPSAEGAAPKESPAEEPAAASAAPAPAPAPADIPTPEKLGRPLTLKEKLAAARAGGAAGASPAPAAAAPTPAADIPTPEKLGRPLTLQEKLAAARAGAGGAAPAAAKPAGAKPAGAKPAGAAAAAKSAAPAAAARTLPPLDKITDPKDLAEALRQAGAKKDKETAGPAEKPVAAKAPAREKETKPQTVLPRPTQRVAQAAAAASRRTFLLFSSWVFVGWASFAAGCVAFTAMMGRFMFPNVLAEPPSTIKIGLPSNFEKEEVNERFKAEWGFWIVRSSVYNGTDIIYALKSICTHLGCPPNWLAGEQKFKCPCHGSGFYISGVNFEGPAPRPLERFKLSLGDDGQLVVDKSQLFQQELGQWADPDSFVNA
jgi:cytochrome b6-f complex iron-sulfur subunit